MIADLTDFAHRERTRIDVFEGVRTRSWTVVPKVPARGAVVAGIYDLRSGFLRRWCVGGTDIVSPDERA